MKKFFLSALLLCSAMLSAQDAGWLTEIFPEKLTNASGKEVDTATALKGKTVAVYFTASWCPPCRSFTPTLVKFYKKTAKKNNLEIVLVSSDKTAEDMKKYMKKYSMPWLAVPFGDDAAVNLKRIAKVSGIPHLAVFDSEGKMISSNARWDVVLLGNKAVEAWKDPDYTPKTFQDYKSKYKKNGSNSKKKKKNKRR